MCGVWLWALHGEMGRDKNMLVKVLWPHCPKYELSRLTQRHCRLAHSTFEDIPEYGLPGVMYVRMESD